MADNDVKEKTQAISEGNVANDVKATPSTGEAPGATKAGQNAGDTSAANPSTSDEGAATPQTGKQRSKAGRSITSGIAFINATFNNTKVTITDLNGNTLCWSSGGKMGMKGSRKSTAYAAQQVAADAARRAQTFGMREVEVRIKGPGAGRESAVRGIAATGLDITSLKDVTPVPHNGCRPPKRRRV